LSRFAGSDRDGHEETGDPTIADSILDRLVHKAYRIELDGESMRKGRGGKPLQE
jgi:hypothetical protein